MLEMGQAEGLPSIYDDESMYLYIIFYKFLINFVFLLFPICKNYFDEDYNDCCSKSIFILYFYVYYMHFNKISGETSSFLIRNGIHT